jgi:hypothetical protein
MTQSLNKWRCKTCSTGRKQHPNSLNTAQKENPEQQLLLGMEGKPLDTV